MKALIEAAGPAPRADTKHTVKPQPAPTPTPEAATAPSTPQQTSNDQPPQGHRSDGVRSDPVPNVASIRPRADVVELRRAVAEVTSQVTALGLAHDRALQTNKASGANKAGGRIRNWKSIGRDWSSLTLRLRALTEAVNNAGPQVSAARVRAVMDQADLVKGLADSVQRALAEAGYPVALAPPTTARSRPRVVEVAGDITTVDVGHNPDPDAVAAKPRRGGIVIPVNQTDGVLPGVGNGSVGGISVAAGRVIDAIHPVGVPTGVAVAGEATGATSVSHVIYVNPPVLNQHEDPSAALYAAYQNALLLADAHGLETVAIQLLRWPSPGPGARSRPTSPATSPARCSRRPTPITCEPSSWSHPMPASPSRSGGSTTRPPQRRPPPTRRRTPRCWCRPRALTVAPTFRGLMLGVMWLRVRLDVASWLFHDRGSRR